MFNLNIESKEIKEIFIEIGLTNKQGVEYKQRITKQRQVFDYLNQLNSIIRPLSNKRQITLVDCACGKNYLSFLADYYFSEVQKKNIRFICIDHNEKLIKDSARIAKNLGFNNMDFRCSSIIDAKLSVRPTVVYSLHACDTATDMTIAKGILENAGHILSVSCCQKTVHDQLRKHPLKSVTRYGAYKTRLADMLADSMRGLVLESLGYLVNIFEFVPSAETPKNIMLKAEKGSPNENRIHKAIQEYDYLQEVFHINPRLLDYLKENLAFNSGKRIGNQTKIRESLVN